MKTLLLIGIGPGDPDALTLAAARAIARLDVLFLLDKAGPGRDELIRFRLALLDRHGGGRSCRVVRADTPERDRAANDYAGAVEDWRQRRADVLAKMIDRTLNDGETGGLMIWGDPALYDGTLTSVEQMRAAGRADLRVEVIPGLSCVQMLTARHGIPLNRPGESITITTGRQLEAMAPESVTNCVVMLDTREAFRHLVGQPGLVIYWGADLGGPDEALVAGPLDSVADRISALVKARRAACGWVMDTYLLRRMPS